METSQFPNLSNKPINHIAPEMVKAVSEGICPLPDCRQPVKMESFRDRISLKEYQISGLCQDCQDKVFADPDED